VEAPREILREMTPLPRKFWREILGRSLRQADLLTSFLAAPCGKRIS
jgi:hypothetical protein